MKTDDAGAFSGTALEGTYRLSLFLGDTSCHLGWYGGPEGYTVSRSTITVLDIPADARSDIVITLPRPAQEMCRTISGRLADEEGSPYSEPPWEAFLHCGRSLIRSRLWDGDAQVDRACYPSYGQVLADQIRGADAAEIDASEDEANRERLY